MDNSGYYVLSPDGFIQRDINATGGAICDKLSHRGVAAHGTVSYQQFVRKSQPREASNDCSDRPPLGAHFPSLRPRLSLAPLMLLRPVRPANLQPPT